MNTSAPPASSRPRPPLSVQVVHLCQVQQHRALVARLIHGEFWLQVPGATEAGMFERLGQASRPDAVPLCLVALHGGQPVGVVNLVDEDDDDHTDWWPWLAGMVVAAPWRGRGVGSALVLALLKEARLLGCKQVFFGTDGPGFYTRLGAVLQEQVRADFCFMRFDIG